MLLMHGGTPKDLESRERLDEALPEDAAVHEPDELGVFEIELDARTARLAEQGLERGCRLWYRRPPRVPRASGSPGALASEERQPRGW